MEIFTPEKLAPRLSGHRGGGMCVSGARASHGVCDSTSPAQQGAQVEALTPAVPELAPFTCVTDDLNMLLEGT